MLLAPSVHRAMAENQNMLVLLFGGAFGFFTTGFHLVADLADERAVGFFIVGFHLVVVLAGEVPAMDKNSDGNTMIDMHTRT